MIKIIIFSIFLFNSIFGREIQYVKITKAKKLKDLKYVEFEIQLENFNTKKGLYLSKIELPSKKWYLPENFQTSVRLPILNMQQVPATIMKCKDLICELLIKYPYRGFDKLSAFILWPTKKHLIQLPIESIVSPNGDQKFIFVEQSKVAIKKEIQLINLNGVFGVTEDISINENIIIFGQERLVDGEGVEVISD